MSSGSGLPVFWRCLHPQGNSSGTSALCTTSHGVTYHLSTKTCFNAVGLHALSNSVQVPLEKLVAGQPAEKVEPEGSLPCSQERDTGLCPELCASSHNVVKTHF
jgi:hypothetical protein